MAQISNWTTQPYQAFVLRCWQEGSAGWRFALEEVGEEGQRHGFGDPQSLTDFLRFDIMGESLEAFPPAASGHIGDNARYASSAD